MKIFAAFRFILFLIPVIASANSSDECYNWAKSGLRLRESPSDTSKVLILIPCGEKVLLLKNEDYVHYKSEGVNGAWQKVSFKGTTGFVFDFYLIWMPYPDKDSTLKDYVTRNFKLLAESKGPVHYEEITSMLEGAGPESTSFLTKTLYENGIHIRNFHGYEYGGESIFLPLITIEQAFLVLKQFKEFGDLLSGIKNLPEKDSVVDGATIRVSPGFSYTFYFKGKNLRISYHDGEIEICDFITSG